MVNMKKYLILCLLTSLVRCSPTEDVAPVQRKSLDMFEEYMPSFVSSMVPQESRTGPVGVAIFGFIVTAALLAMMPLTYFFGFLLGKYFIAPAVWSVYYSLIDWSIVSNARFLLVNSL